MSPYEPHDARTTLRAGGIAALGTEVPSDERASFAIAQCYTHPAIAGRVLVHLSADAVAEGTDAEMIALGFEKSGASGPLGLVRYRRLGFPAWPLVHDPGRARFALEVTQDVRKAKKRAASKPGAPVLHEGDVFGPCNDGRDTGVIAIGVYDKRLLAGFRPGRVQRWDDPMLRAVMTGVVGNGALADGTSRAFALAKWILGEDLRALVTSAAKSALPAGSFEANPLCSAPTLVAEVARTLALSENAAALYLQLLALAEPTEKAVLRWNGWKSKAYDAAVAELASKSLVVLGKRERAQREVFLPGAFVKGRGKNLPMEEWKMPFYAVHPLARHVPSVPVQTLFERAWKRVREGDAPRFDEVR